MKISLAKNYLTRSLTINLAILLSLAFFSCKDSRTEKKDELPLADQLVTLSQEQYDYSDLRLGTFAKDTFYESVHSNGFFEIPPENKVIISSYISGRVKNLNLLLGNKVTKGQDLFQIETPEIIKLQEAYLTAKGQIKNLQSNFERQQSLLSDSLTSEKNFLKSESEYLRAKVIMESVGKQLKLLHINPQELTYGNITSSINIKAPLSGFVSSIKASNGLNLNPSEEALTVINTDKLHLELFIFEKDFSKINKGQRILYNLQNDPKNTYTAEVHLINKSIDSEQRTITIHADLAPEDLNSSFLPGLFVEAFVQTDKSVEFALPKEAIAQIDGKNYVLRLRDLNDQKYTFEKIEVNLGKTNENSIQILNAQMLDLKSQFLLEGSFQLITD